VGGVVGLLESKVAWEPEAVKGRQTRYLSKIVREGRVRNWAEFQHGPLPGGKVKLGYGRHRKGGQRKIENQRKTQRTREDRTATTMILGLY